MTFGSAAVPAQFMSLEAKFVRLRHMPIVPVVTVLVVGTLLTYWSTATGLQCDELLMLRAIELGPVDSLFAPGSSHPPLSRWLMAPVASAVSSDWVVRLPSMLAALLTITVWWSFLRRLIPDPWTCKLLLPAMALNLSWLALGYQCVPYAWLTLFASLHALAWLRLLERPNWRDGVLFVLTGVAAAWSHFYGVNLLFADQLIWLVLLCRRKSLWRLWLPATIATFLLMLPLVPIALFYVRLEQPYSLLQINNFGHYFRWASQAIFGKATFNHANWSVPLYGLWYAAAGLLLWRALRGHGENENKNARYTAGVVATGIFVAGFPAAQLHCLVSGKAMWERYTVLGLWIHWPLIALVAYELWGRRAARWSAALGLACVVGGFMISQAWTPEWTFDHRPVAAHMEQNARPGDAFFAQDFDMWAGSTNIDRLWFDRYVTRSMPVITGPPMGRHEIARTGLPLHLSNDSVRRVWVYSSHLNEDQLVKMTEGDWRLAEVHRYGRGYPLALFERSANSAR